MIDGLRCLKRLVFVPGSHPSAYAGYQWYVKNALTKTEKKNDKEDNKTGGTDFKKRYTLSYISLPPAEQVSALTSALSSRDSSTEWDQLVFLINPTDNSCSVLETPLTGGVAHSTCQTWKVNYYDFLKYLWF